MKLEFLFASVAGILLGGVSPTPGGGSSNGEVSVVEARGGSGDTWYKMKLFIRQPWFIGTMGAVAWIILMIVVLLLYRQRRNKRKSQKALATRGDFLVVFFVTWSASTLYFTPAKPILEGSRKLVCKIFVTFNFVILSSSPGGLPYIRVRDARQKI